MRLTKLGKIIFGTIGLFLVLILYLLFFSGGEEPQVDITQPVKLGFNTPFKNIQEEKAFKKEAVDANSLCDFSLESYGSNRGIPFTADFFIPPSARSSPYYYKDPKTGEQFVPAYMITPDGSGLRNAIGFSEGDTDALPECLSPELGETGGAVLLGFPKGSYPDIPFVKVNGAMWWDSHSLNSRLASTLEGQELAILPAIRMGAYQSLNPSQVIDPASRTQVLNVAIKNRNAVIRVGRIEFGETQTRVWVELNNLSSRPIQPWTGTTTACLRKPGEACLYAGETDEQATEDSLGDTGLEEFAFADLLAEEPIPTRASGGSVSGYIIFPSISPDEEVKLELPGFGEYTPGISVPPIVISIPGNN